MPLTTCFPARLVALAAGCLAVSASSWVGAQPALPSVDALQHEPAVAGELVYRGDTFSQQAAVGAPPLFQYERRIQATSNGMTATHLTRDLAGGLVVVESSTLSHSYAVQRFDVANRQAGFVGSVKVSPDGRHLTFELSQNGKVSHATEEVVHPVVNGQSLFGFIRVNWAALQQGAALPVRMLAIPDKTTYGFVVKSDGVVDGQVSFTLTPSNFIIRMAIAPLRVVFDATTQTLLRYEGRVPPMENVAGKLKALDARVVYTPVMPVFR